MNEIPITPEDQKKVSELYDAYQRRNQEAHDEARRTIVEDFNITEAEAEAHPEMEDRFEKLRSMASNGQNPISSVSSINPDTGEPGSPSPRPPARPYVDPPAAAPPPPSSGFNSAPATTPLQVGEHVLASQGFLIVESKNDYTNGLITFVVKPQ
jgi:hypothetical protein